MPDIRYMNPGGNLTAIVCEPVACESRIALAREIMGQGLAEQVGFEVPPSGDHLGRLEMMGGEFCGNATRAFAYMKVLDEYKTGRHSVLIEISGAKAPVCVEVDLERGEAFTHMPLPIGHDLVYYQGQSFVRVRMDGIDHIMVPELAPDAAMVQVLIADMDDGAEAFGVMFLKKTDRESRYILKPAVYVRATDSLVWESSCGSGSVAAAWYFSMIEHGDVQKLNIVFEEPGGEISVDLFRSGEKIDDCIMGGTVSEIKKL